MFLKIPKVTVMLCWPSPSCYGSPLYRFSPGAKEMCNGLTLSFYQTCVTEGGGEWRKPENFGLARSPTTTTSLGEWWGACSRILSIETIFKIYFTCRMVMKSVGWLGITEWDLLDLLGGEGTPPCSDTVWEKSIVFPKPALNPSE